MKKQQVDHVLRAAGELTGEKQFAIIGSQSLHGKYPNLADEMLLSFEVDLIVKNDSARTEWLNFIGQDSQFHETHGYDADLVDENTATLPKGWQGRLVNLPPGDTQGVSVEKAQLLALLAKTSIDAESRERIRGFIEKDFD
jgi:hypothetical protein